MALVIVERKRIRRYRYKRRDYFRVDINIGRLMIDVAVVILVSRIITVAPGGWSEGIGIAGCRIVGIVEIVISLGIDRRGRIGIGPELFTLAL